MRARVCLLSCLAIPALAVAQDRNPPIHVAPVVPPAFRLLGDPAVQKDINLTDAQKAAAERVRQASNQPVRGLPLGRFGFVPAGAFRLAIDAQTAAFLADGLTKEQRTRLDQILFQLREREFGPHLAFALAGRRQPQTRP